MPETILSTFWTFWTFLDILSTLSTFLDTVLADLGIWARVWQTDKRRDNLTDRRRGRQRHHSASPTNLDRQQIQVTIHKYRISDNSQIQDMWQSTNTQSVTIHKYTICDSPQINIWEKSLRVRWSTMRWRAYEGTKQLIGISFKTQRIRIKWENKCQLCWLYKNTPYWTSQCVLQLVNMFQNSNWQNIIKINWTLSTLWTLSFVKTFRNNLQYLHC